MTSLVPLAHDLIQKKPKQTMSSTMGPHHICEPVVQPATPSTKATLVQIYFLMKRRPTCQLNLVLAYPHAEVTRPTFMRIPKGFHIPTTTQQLVLQIIYNFYRGKDAGCIYFLFMQDYLIKLGFVQSPPDPCIFFFKQIVLMMYIDDFIIGGPTN